MDTCLLFFFFFNDTATTEIYTLSLHDALPIFVTSDGDAKGNDHAACAQKCMASGVPAGILPEEIGEHTSELQSPCNLVCRLLLEKKKCDIPMSTDLHLNYPTPNL